MVKYVVGVAKIGFFLIEKLPNPVNYNEYEGRGQAEIAGSKLSSHVDLF